MANSSDVQKELDKRLSAIYTMNDMYDISNLIKSITDDNELRDYYTQSFQVAAFKKIAAGHPNSEAIAKILLRHLEND